MIRLLQTLTGADAKDVGGKAANLGELHSLGLHVPQGFVISAAVATRFLDMCFAQAEKLLRVPRTRIISEHASDFHPLVLQTSLEPGIETAILDAFGSLNTSRVSVRSSATMEDSATMSFAGIFDTWLGVQRGSLLSAVKKCWLSLYSKRALDYYATHRINFREPRMGVIIQTMIDPDISGVCFTANPISGNEEELCIEAIWGTGEALVSGRATPDTYIYDAPTKTIALRSISPQETKSIWQDGFIMNVPIDSRLGYEQKISDTLLHQLAASCMRIREHYQHPQDIEFAIKDDRLFFLQSRPITTLKRG